MKVQLIGYEQKYGGNGYRLYCMYENKANGAKGYKVLSYRTSEKFGVCFPSVKTVDDLKLGEEYDVMLNEKGRFAGLKENLTDF